jgi:hypothetical protein
LRPVNGEKTLLLNWTATNPLFGEPVNGIGIRVLSDCSPITDKTTLGVTWG